ncbi:T-cell leukemia translocation-altered gene protein isoform X2 [Peromyscus eremicus]|nr:T-cell leukemia translocation-altered gene protein isoform X2 [Peromyscus eremicus]
MLLLTSRRRLRVRPLRAQDACPRVRKLGDEDRQLRGRRRTEERTDRGPRAAGGERERTRAGGGGRAGSDVRAPARPAGSSWRQSRPRSGAHTHNSSTIAQERNHALKARLSTNHCSRVEHHGNSGAIKDRVAILYSPNHSPFKPNPGRPYACAVRTTVTVHPVGRWPVMAEPWSGQFLQALPAMVLGALGTLGSEFLREWETQDMRVTLFKLLLLWLVLSLLGIQLAWGFYGNTVTGLYHRPGLGGQNGSTPDGSTHFPSWEMAANEPLKTHRE